MAKPDQIAFGGSYYKIPEKAMVDGPEFREFYDDMQNLKSDEQFVAKWALVRSDVDTPDRNTSAPQSKIPILEGTGGEASVPSKCHKPSEVAFGGSSYKVPEKAMVEGHREFYEDMVNISDEQLVEKWALVRLGEDDGGHLRRRQCGC